MSARAQRVINVLDLRDSPWVDGPGRTVLETAAHIDTSQFRFIVGSFSGYQENENVYLDTAQERGLETVKIRERGVFDGDIVRQIRRLILDKDIQILHTHEFRSNLYGLLGARGTGVKLASTCHGWITNSRKRELFRYLDKQLLKRFESVTTVSSMIRSELLASGLDPERVTCLQNALVLDKYRRRGTRAEVRKQFNLGDDDIVIAKIGRLSPEKNQVSLIRSLEKIPDESKSIKLLLVGKGPDEEILRRETDTLGLRDKVLFLGYQEDMLPIYEMSDLVIQSSSTEGMPNVVLEALAMEVPVIATDVGGTSQIVTSGETGELLSASDPETLAAAIGSFLAERTRYREMAARGRKLILDKFDFQVRTDELMRAYISLVTNGTEQLAGRVGT